MYTRRRRDALFAYPSFCYADLGWRAKAGTQNTILPFLYIYIWIDTDLAVFVVGSATMSGDVGITFFLPMQICTTFSIL